MTRSFSVHLKQCKNIWISGLLFGFFNSHASIPHTRGINIRVICRCVVGLLSRCGDRGVRSRPDWRTTPHRERTVTSNLTPRPRDTIQHCVACSEAERATQVKTGDLQPETVVPNSLVTWRKATRWSPYISHLRLLVTRARKCHKWEVLICLCTQPKLQWPQSRMANGGNRRRLVYYEIILILQGIAF